MPSEAESDRLQGLTELVRVDYETLEFRGSDIQATVNRGLDAQALEAGQIDFDERDRTRIEIIRSVLATPPRVGEHFEDNDGRFHRIQAIKRTDNTFVCDCEVAGPE